MVGPAAAEAHDARLDLGQDRVAVGPKETLADKPRIHAIPFQARSGARTLAKRSMDTDFSARLR